MKNSLTSIPMLINVFGVSSIGKTSTLGTLYELCKNSGSFQLINYYQFNESDFRTIFTYKGKSVGIMTMGDPGCEKEVLDFLIECRTHSCDRIFTASRSRGAIFGMVIDFANKNGYAFIETSPLHMRYTNGYTGGFVFLYRTFASMLETLI